MDANTLRGEIMKHVGEHEATRSGVYMEDKELATKTDAPLAEVQKQIRILESHGLLDVLATFGPTYSVRLTPRGEQALEPPSIPPSKPRVGY